MSDEATATYEDIINEMTLGAKFIYDEFGVRPTVGWRLTMACHSLSSNTIPRLVHQDYVLSVGQHICRHYKNCHLFRIERLVNHDRIFLQNPLLAGMPRHHQMRCMCHPGTITTYRDLQHFPDPLYHQRTIITMA